MSKNEEKKRAPKAREEGLGRISRREFTIGSVAAIGSNPLILANPPDTSPPFELEISESVRQIMVDRHVLNDDLIKVIEYAERTGDKLYQQGRERFLAKLKLNTVYFYAEYSPIKGGYQIHNTYSHRFELEGSM